MTTSHKLLVVHLEQWVGGRQELRVEHYLGGVGEGGGGKEKEG